MQPVGASYKVQRRVAGANDVRMDGMLDLLARAEGRSVFDIGCNVGGVGFSFYENNAKVVHGCDIYKEGIAAARLWFAQLRDVQSRFEVVDLVKGAPEVQRAFANSGMDGYDFVVCLATYHKIKRLMPERDLSDLMVFFGRWTKKYFAWRGTSHQHEENWVELKNLDKDLGASGLKRVHTSALSSELGLCAVWTR